jgi:hypothetical protein
MDAFNELLGLKSSTKKSPFLAPYTNDEDDASQGKSIEEISILEQVSQANEHTTQDDWVVEPNFVQSTKKDVKNFLDKLQSSRENVRLQGF